MSVNDLRQPTELQRYFDGQVPTCFRCQEPVAGIGVIWAGHAAAQDLVGVIVLHPTCAIELSVDLIGDARNAARVIEGKPLDRGVHVDMRAGG